MLSNKAFTTVGKTKVMIEIITKLFLFLSFIASNALLIIGDKKYGDELVNRYVRDKYRLNNQLLHSGILVLDNKEYKDPLPKLFKKICIDEGLDTNLV